jgi:hypothetical protein
MILALFIYLLIIISLIQNWLFVAAGLVVYFSINFNSVALIPLAMLVDGYFGSYYSIPYFSFAAVIWFVVVEYLRPRFVNFSQN